MKKLKQKLRDAKFAWRRAPRQQKTAIVAIVAILVLIGAANVGLNAWQEATLGEKGGTPFVVEESEESASDANDCGNEGDKDIESAESSSASSSSASSSTTDTLNIAVTEVVGHSEGGIPIDKLPAVVVPKSYELEQQLAKWMSANGIDEPAKAYLYERGGITVAPGETEQVRFQVVVVSDKGPDIATFTFAYAPKTKTLGIADVMQTASGAPASSQASSSSASAR